MAKWSVLITYLELSGPHEGLHGVGVFIQDLSHLLGVRDSQDLGYQGTEEVGYEADHVSSLTGGTD